MRDVLWVFGVVFLLLRDVLWGVDVVLVFKAFQNSAPLVWWPSLGAFLRVSICVIQFCPGMIY